MPSSSVPLLVAALAVSCITSTSADPQTELRKIAEALTPRYFAPTVPARRGLQAELGELSEEEVKKEEKEQEEADDVAFKWTCVVGILALGATYAIGFTLEMYHIHRLPEAGVGVLMGILASGLAYYSGNGLMLAHEKFDFEFFLVYLLPPIIFEAGFNMNVRAFFDNLAPTMFYAFLGTFISTFVVGGIVYGAGQLGLCYPLGLLASLVFGSLISATDPVTVLAVFQALGVKVDLFSMVFGESVLNDAVAIVLVRTLLSFNDPAVKVNYDSVMGACLMFTTIFVGSLVIGIVFGLFSAIVFKALDLRHHDEMVFMECALCFVFPWAAYYTADAARLSGIVAIMMCGIVMATYTRHNFSVAAVKLTAQGFKVVALIAETYVFVYLGMAVFSFPMKFSLGWHLVLVAILACFVGRLHIFVGSGLFNMAGFNISPIYQFIMWFSGLRGGVAFALAAVSYSAMDFPQACGGNPAACEEESMTDGLAIMQTTLIIACFTIFVFGGAITEVAVACDVLEDKKAKKAMSQKQHHPDTAWHRFSTKYLIPILTFPAEIEDDDEGDEARFGAAVSHFAENHAGDKGQVELGGKSGIEEGKLDEMRASLPGLTSTALRKLLASAGGDVQLAIVKGQSAGF